MATTTKSKTTTTKTSTKTSTTKKTGEPSIKGGKNLVIVESPAKSKTIKGFLGKDFEVKASFGHIVDLPSKKLGIDIKNGFEPEYGVSTDKKKVVDELKRLSKNFEKIWLATDEDREGEAIAFHIANVLKLDIKKTPRIVFHEITKTAIDNAVNNPRLLNMDLVNAQQGRRILDRLVGFQVSPVLWKKIKTGLSAGRVQSVAVKLVVEKEKEIQNFKPVESRKLVAKLSYQKKDFDAVLAKVSKKVPKISNIQDVEKIFNRLGLNLKDFEKAQDKKSGNEVYNSKTEITFTLAETTKKDVKKNPSAPFITSSLQQEASRRFGRGVKKVMMVAQKLYENGFITYMRTDSTNLSQLAIGAAKTYIEKEFGKEYSETKQYKSKSANAQEAHEAIRPSYLDKSPEKSGLTGDEKNLYSLIWKRTIASQMKPAVFEATIYNFIPEQDGAQSWISKGEVLKFDGFLKVYDVNMEDEQDEENQSLPNIPENTQIKSKMISAFQNFSKPPARYTESSLVKKLESEGIGRPSTYAPTISTIIDRGYVEIKEKKLHPTEIAFVVVDYLQEHFQNIMDYKFTAQMEETLDRISNGEISRQSMLQDFYKDFEKEIKDAADGEKQEIKTGEKCPQCGSDLVYKFSKMGKFIGCSNYPDCKYTQQTEEEKSMLDTLKAKYEGQPCEAGGTIVVKIGRFGPFLTSSEYPKVKRIKGIPDENLEKLEQQHGGGVCDKCGKGTMHVKKSRKGYFLACDRYPDCKNAKNIK